MKLAAIAIVVGSALIVGVVVWSQANPPRRTVARPDPVRIERQKGDRLYSSEPAKAEAEYRSFIEKFESSPKPKVQDEVAAARLRLGFLAAKKQEFGKARAVFQEAVGKYKGEGAMGSDFGGLKDQAAYQAAVCLMADKKDEEAILAFQGFIKNYALSPLVHAAHRRLEMLDPQHQTQHDVLLQTAVTAQEKHIRFETSVCGPHVIAYLLESEKKVKRGYREIAKLCGTTDEGTTVEGMREGLKALGMDSFGYELNAADFRNLAAPAILLHGDHYVALTGKTITHALLYDPVKGGEVKLPLPKPDQADFSIAALTFEPLKLGAN